MNSHPEVDEMIREQDRFFEAIEFSDDRLADRFVGSVYERIKYVPHMKQWIIFYENRWHLDEDAYTVINEIKDFCFEQASRASHDGDQAAALRICCNEDQDLVTATPTLKPGTRSRLCKGRRREGKP